MILGSKLRIHKLIMSLKIKLFINLKWKMIYFVNNYKEKALNMIEKSLINSNKKT
jgi:hypothetical protein